MASQQTATASSYRFIEVNVGHWKRALEAYYEKKMTPIQGGFQLKVVGLELRRLTLSLYERRSMLMIQGAPRIIDSWRADHAPVIEHLSRALEIHNL